MKIKHTHLGIEYSIPSGNEIAKNACESFGFLLNCHEYRHKEFNGKQFAAIIREYYDAELLSTRVSCEELEKIN